MYCTGPRGVEDIIKCWQNEPERFIINSFHYKVGLNSYIGQPFAQDAREILGAHVQVQIAKHSELHTFKVIPKRWIVERSFA